MNFHSRMEMKRITSHMTKLNSYFTVRKVILTLYVESGIGRQFPQFEGINRLVLRVAALHPQSVDHSIAADFMFVAVLQLHTVLDPLGSLHIGVGDLQREHCVLGFCHSLVPQSFLDLHRYRYKQLTIYTILQLHRIQYKK